MTGTVGILNVGAGDVELRFDNKNPAETIRAARVVRDMLRRGYALLVEVDRDGEKRFERALDFDEKTNCYIVADFDPVTEEDRDAMAAASREAVWNKEKQRGEIVEIETAPIAPSLRENSAEGKRRGRLRKAVEAGSTRAVAVGRSAGG